MLISFLLTVILMPLFIMWMVKLKRGQEIRDEGPAWHQVKSGTPTMGGAIFMVAILVTTLFDYFVRSDKTWGVWPLMALAVVFGVIGFLDDFIKVVLRRNLGLTSGQKFVGQLIGGLGFALLIYFNAQRDNLWIFGWSNVLITLIAIAFVTIWINGFSNAVNLTDGLDGLVGGLGIISFGAYAIIAVHQGQHNIAVFCLTVVASLAGFLVFNHKPAKIFMGDVGSLSLGALLAGISVLLNQEWTLLLIGLVYILETLSVMIQVGHFKRTGNRIFKMSPVHHHFEMVGWSEWKINFVFWGVGLVASAIAVVIAIAL
jgi:phospho-N-acetylmuramoyl-pentapeptide-transferase